MSKEPQEWTGARPRLCFLVMSHTEPSLVERLVRVITADLPDACVLIRHDARAVPFEEERVADLPQVHVRSHHHEAGWGSWEFTRRTLEGVEQALDLEEPWEWLVLVSGQSYPIAPLSNLVEHLAATPSDATLDLSPNRPAAEPAWWKRRPHGGDRARYRFVQVPWTPLMEVRRLRHMLHAVAERQPFVTVFFRHDPQGARRTSAALGWLTHPAVLRGVTPVKTSAWWIVRRSAARSLLTLLDLRGPWHRHFRHTFTSDELAVPTYLCATGETVEDWPLHAMSWLPGAASPETLGVEHLPWLEERSEPFTRKVSLADGGALVDALDELRQRR